MLYTINNQPFINFDYLGIDYDRLYWEIVAFMLQYPVSIYACNGSQTKTPDDHPNMLHPDDVVYSESDRKRTAGFSASKARLYNKIVKGAYYPWSTYNLNDGLTWSQRQDKREKFFPTTVETMPYFVKMITALPIFKHVGWARIYGNEPFNFVHLHRDRSPGILLEEFIYFNLKAKTIYLRHYDSEDRVPMNAKALYFDAANLHGTDPEPCFNFTLRVDGKFTDAFRESLSFSRIAGPSPDPEALFSRAALLKARGLSPDSQSHC